jgi:FkbM family methyltransferase
MVVDAMNNHHPIIEKLKLTEIEVPYGYRADYFGVILKEEFEGALPSGRYTTPSLPPFDDDYFEWIDLAEAISESSGRFVFYELGAGYGRWMVRAAKLCDLLGLQEYHLTGVEAEPTHFKWMNEHLRNNGIKPKVHRLIRGAVSKDGKKSPFYTGNPGKWYGQRLASEEEAKNTPGFDFAAVETLTLRKLMDKDREINLMDLDIQGSEFEVLEAAQRELDHQVRRVHVGTHSTEIEKGLRILFSELGWESHFDYACLTENETPYGPMRFQDGVQSWINRKLEPPKRQI